MIFVFRLLTRQNSLESNKRGNIQNLNLILCFVRSYDFCFWILLFFWIVFASLSFVNVIVLCLSTLNVFCFNLFTRLFFRIDICSCKAFFCFSMFEVVCDRAKQMNELVGFSLTTALFIVIGVFVIIRFWIRSCFYFFFFRPLQSHWCFRLERNSRRIQQNKTKQNTGSRVSTKK
jgi:hypothetical protein